MIIARYLKIRFKYMFVNGSKRMFWNKFKDAFALCHYDRGHIQEKSSQVLTSNKCVVSSFEPQKIQHRLAGTTDQGRFDTNEISKVVFQSTCHLAMESCNRNRNCRLSLSPILHHCDISRCNRNSCMEALQGFYRKPGLPWNLDIAFCLCK